MTRPRHTRRQPAPTAGIAEVEMPLGTGTPPFTTVLWDLDGTITDSAPGIISSIQKMLDTLGLAPPSHEELVSYIGPPILDSFRKNHLDDALELEHAYNLYREIYEEDGELNSRVYPGIARVVRAIHAAGIPMSTATSKNEQSAARVLRHYGLARYFDAIVGATIDESRSAKADVVAEALRVLDEKDVDLSNVIMIGDRFYDVEGAAAHGIPCIYVTWGYGAAGEEAGAVAVANSASDLLRFLGLDRTAS